MQHHFSQKMPSYSLGSCARLGLLALAAGPSAAGMVSLTSKKGFEERPRAGTASRAPFGARPPPADVLVLSETAFRKAYPLTEVGALWTSLVKAMDGDKELAMQALRRNPTVINPRYTWPPALIDRSKSALSQSLGSEKEARSIILKNPAVLQCGVSLSDQSADEIRRFAAVRALLDSVPSWASTGSIFFLFGVLGANLVLLRGDLPQDDPMTVAALSVTRPLLGAIGATLFSATVLAAAKASSDKPGAGK